MAFFVFLPVSRESHENCPKWPCVAKRCGVRKVRENGPDKPLGTLALPAVKPCAAVGLGQVVKKEPLP